MSGHGFGGRSSKPPLPSACRRSEMEGRYATRDDDGLWDEKADRVGQHQAVGLITYHPAETVGPGDGGGELETFNIFRLPNAKVRPAMSDPTWVHAELITL